MRRPKSSAMTYEFHKGWCDLINEKQYIEWLCWLGCPMMYDLESYGGIDR